MLAIGAGGLDVALAMAGEPYSTTMPAIFGVELTGALPDWVSAKDVMLEMLRRHGVCGGVGRIIEYHGAGLRRLTAMDRHVIANMGAELGATTSVFPSDEMTRAFLESQGRGQDWRELTADRGLRLRPARSHRSFEARTAHRQAVKSWQGRCRPRSPGRGDRPVLHRLLRQSGMAGLRRRRGNRPGSNGPARRILRRKSDVAASAARC